MPYDILAKLPVDEFIVQEIRNEADSLTYGFGAGIWGACVVVLSDPVDAAFSVVKEPLTSLYAQQAHTLEFCKSKQMAK